MGVLDKYEYTKPTPIQSQAVPACMAGLDVIAIAKTGSGKTLAYLLPMFRHIMDQPPLDPSDGPIALIMVPTRELGMFFDFILLFLMHNIIIIIIIIIIPIIIISVFSPTILLLLSPRTSFLTLLAVQIHTECTKFVKATNIRSACVYGGAGVKHQIGDLKRGAEIVVCTPGRMIDVLCANKGRVTNLKRVTFLVLDEADRMFDMGFVCDLLSFFFFHFISFPLFFIL
jgi:ATP-dependent RNA helicase DDX46/PRP5